LKILFQLLYTNAFLAGGNCQCGGPYSIPFPYNRIIGGSEVPPHSLPFQVFIDLTGRTDGITICGGSLISPNYVLTAAHCTNTLPPANIKVTVGKHNRNIKEDGEQTFYVVSNTVHPQFNSSINDNDFALLKISTPVNIPLTNSGVGIVCLPTDLSQTFVGTKLTVSGWGTTVTPYNFSTDPYSNVLKATFLTGITNDECKKTWGSDRTITSNMLCASVVTSAACHGDSGGKKINTIVISKKVTSYSQLNFEIFDEKIEKAFLFNSNYLCIGI
jgi:secreted trypsin-like serine protease